MHFGNTGPNASLQSQTCGVNILSDNSHLDNSHLQDSPIWFSQQHSIQPTTWLFHSGSRLSSGWGKVQV